MRQLWALSFEFLALLAGTISSLDVYTDRRLEDYHGGAFEISLLMVGGEIWPGWALFSRDVRRRPDRECAAIEC